MALIPTDQTLIRATSIVVLGSLGIALASLTWRLTGWDDGRTEVAIAATLPDLRSADADVTTILALAPFGRPSAAAGAMPSHGSELTLKGVFSATPAPASTALISMGDAPAAIYSVGESPGGVGTIESIQIDHVILLIGGQRSRLDFPNVTSPTSAHSAAAPAPAAQLAVPERSAAAQAALASSSPIAMAAEAAARNAQPTFQITGPPPDIGQAAATVGAIATTAGYRIGPNPSPELRRFGLQPGDVVESVNGQPVGAGASDERVFERARADGRARVVVVRGGRRVTFTFPLQ